MSINHENLYKNERESRWELAKENEYNAIMAIANILRKYYPNVKHREKVAKTPIYKAPSYFVMYF